jgi:hypothetical protein
MRKLTPLFMLAIMVTGCKSRHDISSKFDTTDYTFPDVITVDTANKMVNSYLNSVNYLSTDTNIQCVTFPAGLVRKYLDSLTGSSSIAYLKISFAHQLVYINNGHQNVNSGFSKNALTVILSGCDTNGSYIYYAGNSVIDNGMICPTNCPPGDAANPLFPTPRKNGNNP